MWNEISYRIFNNRENERELDVFELEELRNMPCDCDKNIYYYGLYEDISCKNTFGVEDLFEFDCEV